MAEKPKSSINKDRLASLLLEFGLPGLLLISVAGWIMINSIGYESKAGAATPANTPTVSAMSDLVPTYSSNSGSDSNILFPRTYNDLDLLCGMMNTGVYGNEETRDPTQLEVISFYQINRAMLKLVDENSPFYRFAGENKPDIYNNINDIPASANGVDICKVMATGQ